MTPKKDEYMRGYSDGFKDGMSHAASSRKHVFVTSQDGGSENCAVCGSNWRNTDKHLTQGDLDASSGRAS